MTKILIFLLLFNVTNFPLSQAYFNSADDSSEKQCFCEVSNKVI